MYWKTWLTLFRLKVFQACSPIRHLNDVKGTYFVKKINIYLIKNSFVFTSRGPRIFGFISSAAHFSKYLRIILGRRKLILLSCSKYSQCVHLLKALWSRSNSTCDVTLKNFSAYCAREQFVSGFLLYKHLRFGLKYNYVLFLHSLQILHKLFFRL